MDKDKSDWTTVRGYAAGDSRRSWWATKITRRVGKRADELMAEAGVQPVWTKAPERRRADVKIYPPDVLEQAYRWVRNNSPDEWPTPSADK